MASVRADVAKRKAQNQTVALVPTMGALHAGHLSLIRHAQTQADAVLASIFVNPTQFGPNEDFDRYPRQLEKDMALLESEGCMGVYSPSIKEMYPQGFATTITVADSYTGHLCGAHRPGHFDGVATVVAKLLLQVQPDIAVFGEKDFQQLQIIRRMVADLNLPLRIEGAPIIREADGLAMSSRNAYLTPQQREAAPHLHRLLRETAQLITEGEAIEVALPQMQAQLLAEGFDTVDYVELVEAGSLQPIDRPTTSARLLAAAVLGKTRLIDNIALEG